METPSETQSDNPFYHHWFGDTIRKVLLLIPVLMFGAFVAFGFSLIGAIIAREGESFMSLPMKKSQRITAALRTYAESSGGVFPRTLDELVTAKLLEPADLSINLMDGKPPVLWVYLPPKHGVSEDVVLVSPPISNNVGNFMRGVRAVFLRQSLPMRDEMWIFAWLNGSAECVHKSRLKSMAKAAGVELSNVPLSKTDSSRQ